jgi:hypothetical protein
VGRVRWSVVLVGTGIMLLLLSMFAGVVGQVYEHLIREIATDPRPGPGGGFTFTSSRQWELYQTLSTLSYLFAGLFILLAFFLGGLLVVRKVPSSLELSGSIASLICIAVVFASVLAGVMLWLAIPSVFPDKWLTRLGFLYYWGASFVAVCPFAVVCGYFGAQLGGYLRARASTRASS